MRRMSFMKTIAQIQARTKTVTRRLGWSNIRVGERLLAVDKARVQRKGDRALILGVIEVVSVREERLGHITEAELVLEGFPGWPRESFLKMFCTMNECNALDVVRRIEFKYIDDPDNLGHEL
jgi:hypothetical protein